MAMDQDRHAAYLILKDVQTEETYSNLAVNRHVRNPGVRAPAFVRELAYGVLRNQLLLDYNIDHLLRDPKTRLKPGLRILLRMGLYQLIGMDGVSDYAAVDETVKLAGRFFKGQRGFVNGVLRAFVRSGKSIVLPDPADEIFYLSVRYSCHAEIVAMWLRAYGTETARGLLESSRNVPPLTLRTNLLMIRRPELMEALVAEGFAPEAGRLTETAVCLDGGEILSGDLYRGGFFSVQDESSQLAVQLLDPRPGDCLLDLCAAPGGKSCAAAEHMMNRGNICSYDIHAEKLHRISDEAKRLGIAIIETSAGDSSRYDPTLDSVADCVWVDAPCSGLGVVRRKPEIKLQPFKKKEEALRKIQTELLAVAGKYVRQEGRLLYTTCTVNPAENEEVTDAFLAANPEYKKEEQVQLLPSVHGTDGFYICLMRRQNDQCRI
ncbi:MAG: 16S rRNA (cytosine(967)-C(5))-methyltransferase RsmB [Clostridiales bacterium]|nr:16S rRNA (cytosine(967)-C(5))-methyltransferase RsmB [Clostridiales bacterium]